MTVVAFLSWLVVIRTNHQCAIGACLLGKFCQAYSLSSAVGPCARKNFDAAGGSLGDGGDHSFVFLVIERGRLARGAHGRKAIGALLNVPINQLEQGRKIDLATAKRGDQGDGQTREEFSLGGHGEQSGCAPAPGANEWCRSYAFLREGCGKTTRSPGPTAKQILAKRRN